MKQKLIAYLGLGFFALLFAFLIGGLVILLLNFSVEGNGLLPFMSVIIPQSISLAFIGYNLVVYILKVKTIHQPVNVVDKTEKKS
jgi:hypothetical protein